MSNIFPEWSLTGFLFSIGASLVKTGPDRKGGMRVLIVDDDFISRRLLQKILSAHGDCDIAVDGAEAIKAFELAWERR